MHLNVKILSALLLLLSEVDISAETLKMLACYANLLKEGVSKHNVPSLDPLSIEKLRIDLNSDIFRGYIAINNFLLKGILDIKVTDWKANLNFLNGTKIEVDHSLNLEEIVLETDYDTELMYYSKYPDLYGKGHLSAKLSNLGISGRIVLRVESQKIALSEFTLKSSLGVSTIKFSGLFNDEHLSEMISKNLSYLIPKYIEENSETLSNFIMVFLTLAPKTDLEIMMEILSPCFQIFNN